MTKTTFSRWPSASGILVAAGWAFACPKPKWLQTNYLEAPKLQLASNPQLDGLIGSKVSLGVTVITTLGTMLHSECPRGVNTRRPKRRRRRRARARSARPSPGARPGVQGITTTAPRINCAASKLRCEKIAHKPNGSAGRRGA